MTVDRYARARSTSTSMLALSLIDSVSARTSRRRRARSSLKTPGVATSRRRRDADRCGGGEQRMRLKPLLAHTNFWRSLSVDPLTRPSRLVRTTADIAFAQAQALLAPVQGRWRTGAARSPRWLQPRTAESAARRQSTKPACPSPGSSTQRWPPCSLEPAPARVLHLDLELHQALLTVLEHTGQRLGGG